MLSLLIAILVGNWGYEGFASDPAPAEPVPPASVPSAPLEMRGPVPNDVPPAPTPPPAPAVEVGASPSVAPERPSVPKPRPPKVVKPRATPPRPMSWRLADRSGQVWEHTDPVWLRRWVAYRNAILSGPVIRRAGDPANPRPDGTCTSGRCEPPR